MFKKSLGIFLCLMMLLNMFPLSSMATDVQQSLPINDGMETIDAVARIKSTIQSGSVSLTQDKVSGKFAVKVISNDEPGKDYVSYTLANSVSFAVYEHSQIKLWVKPGAGAKWIKFLTGGSLITCDKNSDGVFKVGEDLVSGQWNDITLDLNKTTPKITMAKDLVVTSNDLSTWSYDEVISVYVPILNMNLNDLLNTNTQIVADELRFKSNGSNIYDVNPTILVSGKHPDYSRTDTTQNDFQQGTLNNLTATTAGSLEIVTSSATKTEDFEDSTYTFGFSGDWIRVGTSPYSGSWCFRNKQIDDNQISSTQVTVDLTCAGSVTFFYRVSSESGYDYFNFSIDEIGKVSNSGQTGWIQVSFPLSAGSHTLKWRYSKDGSSSVGEDSVYIDNLSISGFPGRPPGNYVSPALDISSVNTVESSSINWNATIPNDTSLNVETSLSYDCGNTWTAWQEVANGEFIPGLVQGINLNNTRLRYRVNLSTNNQYISSELHSINITVKGGIDYGKTISLLNGKISNIYINSSYSTSSEPLETIPLQRLYLSGVNPSIFAVSGDGTKVIYSKPEDANKIYSLNLNNGNNVKITDYVPVIIKVNFDGTKVAFKDSSNNLYLYDEILNKTILVSANTSQFSVQNDGTVCYFCTGNTTLYILSTVNPLPLSPPGTVCLSGQAVSYLDISKEGKQIFYSNGTSFYTLTLTPAGWKFSLLTTMSKTIDGLWTNNDGSMVFIKTLDGLFVYEVLSRAIRKMDVNISTIIRVAKNNKLITLDPNYKYQLYDPGTDMVKDIRPADAANNSFDVDGSGTKIVYVSTSGLSTYYFNGVQRPERYLFSFDGKNSWYSYNKGTWTVVKTGTQPVKEDFDKYGMTIDEVNTMDEGDFESLYTGGKQVLHFDIAVYFASVDPYITPSLKSIMVTLKGGEPGPNGDIFEKALYTSKQQSFNSSTWRKIRKIYPVEIQPKEAEMYYFIIKDGSYKTYKNSQWVDVNSTILSDIETNWIDSINGQGITQLGMTAEELRAVPESALNSLLPANNLSVVYAMKVQDISTESYSSLITIDYVENLFDASLLTLKIKYVDGTFDEYPNLTKTQVEDFMEWVNERQYNRGPIFYCIKTVSNGVEINDFINYYTIKSVSVNDTP